MNADAPTRPVGRAYHAWSGAEPELHLAHPQPVKNSDRAAEPDQPHNIQGSVRLDWNKSASSRFFIRANGNKFEESSLVDWTYDSPDPKYVGLHDVARARFSWSATGTWTKVINASTLIDTQISGNRAHQRDTRKNMVSFTPTSVGLPSYMDEFCKARFECILPQVTFAEAATTRGGWYRRRRHRVTTSRAVELTSTRGSHTFRGGVDLQWASAPAATAREHGTFTYDNTYTVSADTTKVSGAGPRPEPAAFMMGCDHRLDRRQPGVRRPQQLLRLVRAGTWRLGQNLSSTSACGSSTERHQEQQDRAMLWFDRMRRWRSRPPPRPPTRRVLTPRRSAFKVAAARSSGLVRYGESTWKPSALDAAVSLAYRLGRRASSEGYGSIRHADARDWTPTRTARVTTSNPSATTSV